MGKKLCTPATLAATVPPSTTVVMHLFLGAHVCAVIRVIVVSIIVVFFFFIIIIINHQCLLPLNIAIRNQLQSRQIDFDSMGNYILSPRSARNA